MMFSPITCIARRDGLTFRQDARAVSVILPEQTRQSRDDWREIVGKMVGTALVQFYDEPLRPAFQIPTAVSTDAELREWSVWVERSAALSSAFAASATASIP